MTELKKITICGEIFKDIPDKMTEAQADKWAEIQKKHDIENVQLKSKEAYEKFLSIKHEGEVRERSVAIAQEHLDNAYRNRPDDIEQCELRLERALKRLNEGNIKLGRDSTPILEEKAKWDYIIQESFLEMAHYLLNSKTPLQEWKEAAKKSDYETAIGLVNRLNTPYFQHRATNLG